MLDLPVRWPSVLLGHFFCSVRPVASVLGGHCGSEQGKTAADSSRSGTVLAAKNGTGWNLGWGFQLRSPVLAQLRRKIQRCECWGRIELGCSGSHCVLKKIP